MADDKEIKQSEPQKSEKSIDVAEKIQRARELGYQEGFMTACAQLQLHLIQNFATKVLGVKSAKELTERPEADHVKLAETPVKLGVFLSILDGMRTGIADIMTGKTPATDPANEEKTLDSGLVLT